MAILYTFSISGHEVSEKWKYISAINVQLFNLADPVERVIDRWIRYHQKHLESINRASIALSITISGYWLGKSQKLTLSHLHRNLINTNIPGTTM
jgi:hypothetical protein